MTFREQEITGQGKADLSESSQTTLLQRQLLGQHFAIAGIQEARPRQSKVRRMSSYFAFASAMDTSGGHGLE
eukprot:6424040-Lingulodinium_polyedra.AAC.1